MSEVTRPTIVSLTHNEVRRDDPRSGRAGWPTGSGRVASLIEQFPRRGKRTETFWDPTPAETIRPMRAADLCEDERFTKHLKARPVSASRTSNTTKRRKAG
ncbi:MAG: hypothetical protein JO252_20600 [Planctomycetaceae bacterium]|nr:hypothetical protein [Planctomycetaceae bacterium]